jgi:hypothetical protein
MSAQLSGMSENVTNTVDNNVILIYKGIMNNMILSLFTKFIETRVYKFPKISRKINRVIIELAQNIAYYSEDRFFHHDENRGVGLIILKELNDSFLFVAKNKIRKEVGKNLLFKCNYINTLDTNKLKYFRAKQRDEAAKYENRCNIGLIQVALISGNKLIPEIIEIDEKYSDYNLYITFDK